MPDPLDGGSPTEKHWEEFRAQYAAALLAHWVSRELADEATEAVSDLRSRLWVSLDSYPDMMRQEAEASGVEWDGEVPFHHRDSEDITWVHVDDLSSFYHSLFPHDLKDVSIGYTTAASTVVGLHSALEAYSRAMGVDVRGGVVEGVRKWVRARGGDLPSGLAEALDDFDATRHVIVHNRGCVDDRYLRCVRKSPFQVGELRALTSGVVDEFATAVVRAAHLIHAASA